MTTDGPTDRRGADPHSVPVVGVGASAGGLEAFGLLLAGLPADTGMAYVLIQHLAPASESLLTEILGRKTTLPVREAHDGVRLEPDHVYVVAAGTEILLVDGRLSVIPRESKATVDLFFSTLAQMRKERAIGVVLSGTGSDGTAGALAIRNEGGLVLAQDPKSCAHDGMPASVIASGAVDLILPPEAIGRQLARIARHPFVRTPASQEPAEHGIESGLASIIASLEASTAVSFGEYKPNTILRRSLRRMAIHSINHMDRYAEFVRTHPEEGQALFRDVLIHVTSFFRDPATFDVLKEVAFPKMLEQRRDEAPVKMWVPGCASGQEAFSIAIAFREYLDAQRLTIPFHVFATDLDEVQIAQARASLFPETIEADIAPERLKQFFVRTPNGYRVNPEIRERCVFARHDLLGDPPFSRIDLISCRNVMIYFGTAIQRKLIPMFHYALSPGGFLVLGGSEGIGAFGNLFSATDEKHRVFRRRDGRGSYAGQPVGVGESRRPPERSAAGAFAASTPGAVRHRTDEFLARKFAPPAVVIDGALSIVQFRGDTSPYLAPAPGVASLNILRMARPGLEVGLRAAIQEATSLRQPVRREGLRLRQGEVPREVNVEVEPFPVPGVDDVYLMVVFEEAPAVPGARAHTQPTADAPKHARKPARRTPGGRIAELERELAAARSDLQEIVAARDEANETYQSVNEDMLSANEELQSINEELATAKEELQATNEELNTLNDELRSRIVELARLSDELTHVLAGVGAPVVVVDHALTVRRVSVGAEDVFQGEPPAVGSLLTSGQSSFDFAREETVLREVVARGVPRTIPMPRRDGRRFLLRLQPYQRTDGQIDGVVLVVVDVEELEQRVAERTSALQTSNDRMVMFSYSVAHDLRAPLRAMRGYADALIDEDGPELGPVRRHYVSQVIEAAGRLDTLILGLLAFSRITNITLLTEPVDLNAAVSDGLHHVRAETEERQAEVEIDVPSALPPVIANADVLSRVIGNLMANAIKFVPADQRPRVRIHAQDRGAVVRLWVEDNGIGIHPRHHARIFGVFERLHPSDKFAGVGIGLAFAKQALNRMNGAIGLESALGEGSRFWIELPVDGSRPQAAAQVDLNTLEEASADEGSGARG